MLSGRPSARPYFCIFCQNRKKHIAFFAFYAYSFQLLRKYRKQTYTHLNSKSKKNCHHQHLMGKPNSVVEPHHICQLFLISNIKVYISRSRRAKTYFHIYSNIHWFISQRNIRSIFSLIYYHLPKVFWKDTNFKIVKFK